MCATKKYNLVALILVEQILFYIFVVQYAFFVNMWYLVVSFVLYFDTWKCRIQWVNEKKSNQNIPWFSQVLLSIVRFVHENPWLIKTYCITGSVTDITLIVVIWCVRVGIFIIIITSVVIVVVAMGLFLRVARAELRGEYWRMRQQTVSPWTLYRPSQRLRVSVSAALFR